VVRGELGGGKICVESKKSGEERERVVIEVKVVSCPRKKGGRPEEMSNKLRVRSLRNDFGGTGGGGGKGTECNGHEVFSGKVQEYQKKRKGKNSRQKEEKQGGFKNWGVITIDAEKLNHRKKKSKYWERALKL